MPELNFEKDIVEPTILMVCSNLQDTDAFNEIKALYKTMDTINPVLEHYYRTVQLGSVRIGALCENSKPDIGKLRDEIIKNIADQLVLLGLAAEQKGE